MLPPSCACPSRVRALAGLLTRPCNGGIRLGILGTMLVLPATLECCSSVLRCHVPPVAALWKPRAELLVSINVIAYSDVSVIIRRLQSAVKVSVGWTMAGPPMARRSPSAPADRVGAAMNASAWRKMMRSVSSTDNPWLSLGQCRMPGCSKGDESLHNPVGVSFPLVVHDNEIAYTPGPQIVGKPKRIQGLIQDFLDLFQMFWSKGDLPHPPLPLGCPGGTSQPRYSSDRLPASGSCSGIVPTMGVGCTGGKESHVLRRM